MTTLRNDMVVNLYRCMPLCTFLDFYPNVTCISGQNGRLLSVFLLCAGAVVPTKVSLFGSDTAGVLFVCFALDPIRLSQNRQSYSGSPAT